MRRRVATVLGVLAIVALAVVVLARARDREESDSGTRADEVPTEKSAPVAPTTLSAHGPVVAGDDMPAASVGRGGDGHGVPPKTAAIGRTVHVSGRVVDEKGAAVAGANVETRTSATSAVRIESGDDGKFAFDVDRPDDDARPGILVVRREGRVGLGWIGWRPGWGEAPGPPRTAIDVGDVVLADAVALDVLVRDARGAAAVADVVVYAGAGAIVLAPTTKTDVSGKARVEGLPRGQHVVTATTDASRGVAAVTVPRTAEEPLEIELRPVVDVDVTVVEAGSHAAVVGARIRAIEFVRLGPQSGTSMPYLPPLDAPPTDETGHTHVRVMPWSLEFRAVADGYADPQGDGFSVGRGTRLATGATSVVVELARRRRMPFAMEAGDGAPPEDGTALTVRAGVGSGLTEVPAAGHVEHGEVVVDGVGAGFFSAVAFAPDGRQARLFAKAGEDRGMPTKFLNTPKLEVVVRWEDGTPAEGVVVSLRNQGNNPFGKGTPTDANGRAVFEGLERQMADVYVSTAAVPWGGRRVATNDIGKSGSTIAVTVPRSREATVRVLLDGVPGLPPTLWSLRPDAFPGEVSVLSRDETAGLVRLRYWPSSGSSSSTIPVGADGWVQGAPLVVPAGAPDPVELRLDLSRAGSLDVAVVPPTDGRYRLGLESFEHGAWVRKPFDSQMQPPDDRGHWRLPTLAPGRYRVREGMSSAQSEEVAIVGGATASLRFDLSGVGFASGRVVVPEDESAQGILVRVEPRAPSPGFPLDDGARTDADGSFRLRVPGSNDVTLTAEHILLSPAKDGGSARVRAGAENVVLRLVRGSVVTVRFEPALPITDTRYFEAMVDSVHLWRGPMAGAPVASRKARIDGATAKIGGVEPGRWSLMFDIPPAAPMVFENVDVGDGETLLGPVAPPAGSAVVLDLRVPAGQSPPRLYVSARRVDALPAYVRGMNTGSTSRIRLPGLGRGRFRVVARPEMGGSSLLDREVDVDGIDDVPLTVDVK